MGVELTSVMVLLVLMESENFSCCIRECIHANGTSKSSVNLDYTVLLYESLQCIFYTDPCEWSGEYKA